MFRGKSNWKLGKEVSRGPVPDPETLGLGVRYPTPSQPSEEWLGVRH